MIRGFKGKSSNFYLCLSGTDNVFIVERCLKERVAQDFVSIPFD